MGSKIVYADLSLNGFNLEAATQVKNDALPTISRLLGKLSLRDHCQRPVTVTVKLDEFSYDKKAFKQAKAARLGDGDYLIEIGVGLLGQLSFLAKAIVADKSVLRGRTKSNLLNSVIRRDGRGKALGDFIFHYMLTFVIWHEVAHIALGHLDWLGKNAHLNAIEEFGQNQFLDHQTLEGDADRQASMWTAAGIDCTISSNPFLRYPVLADAFHDIGYIYGALFGFLDSVDGDVPASRRKHPKADVRCGVALSSLERYLVQYRKDLHPILLENVYAGGFKAISTIHHSDKKPFNAFDVAGYMEENGQRIDAMQLRSLQHSVSNSSCGSFKIWPDLSINRITHKLRSQVSPLFQIQCPVTNKP